jgi:signal transduction histidine kinase
MRITQSLLLADRITIAFRWILLMIFTVLLSQWGTFTDAINFTLVVAGLVNFSLTIISLINRRLPFHPQISIVFDLVFITLIFYFTNGSNSPLFWTGLIPLFSAAIYFGVRGGLIVSLVTILSLLLSIYLSTSLTFSSILDNIALPSGLIIISGLILGYMGRLLGYQLQYRHVLELSRKGETERKERERTSTLYNITSTLTATLNYQRVLELALDMSASALADPNDRTTNLVSAFLLFDNERLRIGSARRFTQGDLRVSLLGKEGLIAEAIEAGESINAGSLQNDPELNRIIALRSCESCFCYPLRSGHDVYGVLLYGHPDANFFTSVRCQVLEIIGRQVTVALQNALLYNELEEEKQRMIEVHEEVQRKLARNLHDGPTQSVAAIAMRVNFARRLIERDVKGAAEELYKIEDLARRTTKEIRHMLFTLRPLVLESSGLIAALESMAKNMRDTYNLNVIIQAEPAAVEGIEIGKQGVIFFIIEEAVNNSRKHANASNTWIRLPLPQEEILLLEIEDDGSGFDVGAIDSDYENRGSLGMVNMRERAEMISGVFRVESKIGRGTRIRVWIPLTENAADRIRQGS